MANANSPYKHLPCKPHHLTTQPHHLLAEEMLRIPTISARNWVNKFTDSFISVVSFFAFAFLDLLDCVFCLFYRWVDGFLEGNVSACYCQSNGEQSKKEVGEKGCGVSETLHGRKNIFRDMGVLQIRRKTKRSGKNNGSSTVTRWSDCSCDSCVSWRWKTEHKLHFVVQEPKSDDEWCRNSAENVIFLHGFLSSSMIWTETVFPNLSESSKKNYKLFAVDLLGFGRSPKPTNCLYTLEDHLSMIEQSILEPFELESFHLVAHSMGCIVALAIAAKSPNSVKSITLIAPPYFPSPKDKASQTMLNRLAKRRVWPPLLFGASFMSWYEHLGRSVCLLVCKNHRTWESIIKLLTRKRDLHFILRDLTRHTHHSAWHSMHNVIAGGARLLDDYFEALSTSTAQVKLVHGDRDELVPVECSYNIKAKVPRGEVQIVTDADHNTVILGREKDFTRDLEKTWISL
ncbi:hypothetical protein ACLOJK_000078 [Asimina triloba]